MSTGSVTVNGVNIPGEFDASSGYFLSRYGRPSMVAARNYAENEWVDGAFLLSARRQQATLALSVWVYGTEGGTTLLDRLDALEAAVSDFTFEVTTEVNGEETVWVADMGDFALGNEEWDGPVLEVDFQLVNLVIPVHPTSTAGGS